MTNAVSPEPTATDLLVRLLKMASFISAPMRDGVCEPAGISTNELRVVMALAGEGALAGHDLVEITGLPPMNVSRAIAALREQGWIEDAVDPDNRRRRPVRLTDAGHDGYGRIQPHIDLVANAVLGTLTQRQRTQLAGLSDRLNDSLVEWIRAHHAGIKL